jgi:hypothetical protein
MSKREELQNLSQACYWIALQTVNPSANRSTSETERIVAGKMAAVLLEHCLKNNISPANLK